MKKMEEMMELMTEEIDGFNKSIKKLEGLSEKLEDLKIKVDTSNIEFHIKQFAKEQKQTNKRDKEKTTEIHQAIKLARITPNWLAILLCLMVSIQTLSLSYYAYHFIRFEDKRMEAFHEGRVVGLRSVRGYFEDHAIIYEDFKKWTRKKDSISNQQ
ncbi:DUF6730 family protein [Maribacter sp. 2210JD10-5]|uniref:DUF6730 family protein n=1 Tax=Maribacter sp. 2210JD10-5 TaxID=3386272 RepID=UPI0039BD49DB